MRLSEQLRNETNNNDRLCEDFPDVWEMLNEAADLLDVYYIQCKATTQSIKLSEAKLTARAALKEDV